jgi:hypothetical protein
MLLLPLWAFVACYRVTFTLPLTFTHIALLCSQETAFNPDPETRLYTKHRPINFITIYVNMFHPRLDLPNDLHRSDLPPENMYEFIFLPIYTTCPVPHALNTSFWHGMLISKIFSLRNSPLSKSCAPVPPVFVLPVTWQHKYHTNWAITHTGHLYCNWAITHRTYLG